ncbi:MAG: PucR family transcriptional regulator ligand-binding domain-containing protein [Chloroflexota bacterium]|nr:PucR family transcriptional regulator ligand-binding domain-containing protein [Chloroflexota bacterium]
MPLTVLDLIDDPNLGLEVVVENDLDRRVRWVHTTELADPSRYLQGDEVILTTGVWIEAGTPPADFVRPLQRSRIAALGYGLPAPDAEVPPKLVAACRRSALTLFRVPFELPFIAIGEAFVERLASDRQAALEATVERNAAFVRAAEHSEGLDGVLRVLSRARSLHPWVIGPGGRVLAHSGYELSPDQIEMVSTEAGRLQAEYPVRVPEWLIFPIVSVGRTDAHLVVASDQASLAVDDRSAVDQALPFVGLELARRRALHESERRFAAELIDLIGAGPAQLVAATARLEAFGIDPEGALAGIVCEVPSVDDGANVMERALARAGVTAVVATKGAELVGIVAWSGPERGLVELARELCDELGEQAAVGIGGLAAGADALTTSLIEARHACRFARRRRQGRAFATHGEVGSHTMLLALQDENVLAAFRRALLQPLEEHDARRHTELVATLDEFLASGGRWQQTAGRLHVHVNTLRHRLARVEQLTGRSLESMDDRVDFYIALHARP